MKASELRGRAVVSLAEAQKVGEVDDVLLAPAQSRVAGFRIKHGLLGPHQHLSSPDVHSVGPDAIIIQSRDLLREQLSPPDLQPLADLSALSGIKVVSESGTLLGVLQDAELDP